MMGPKSTHNEKIVRVCFVKVHLVDNVVVGYQFKLTDAGGRSSRSEARPGV